MLDLSLPLHLTIAVVPELIVMVGAMLLLLWAAWRPESAAHQRAVGIAAIGVAVLGLVAVSYYVGRFEATDGAIAVDNFRWLMSIVILIGTIATIALGIEDNERVGIHFAESHVLVLLASSGMMLLAGARDLMMIFLGIELMSIAMYALAGMNRRNPRSAEGALKYFLLGAFSTAFMLYGMALIYGATGSVRLAEIGERVLTMNLVASPIFLIGIAMLLVGFGFKVSSVPFHMYAPDVYEGAPTAITAYMAATVKAAAFAAFIRIWLEAFPLAADAWRPAVAVLAIATMIIGNAVGLAQRNLKRLLAYSSIGHAGYLLVAIAAGTSQGASAMVFYLLAYTIATFGAFAVISMLGRPGDGRVTTDDISGLWHVQPSMAIAMSIFMLALLGFPFFGGAGFLAKWYIIKAALEAAEPQTMLVVVMAITSVIAAGYYLYVVMVMFMRVRPEGSVVPAGATGMTRAIIVVAAALTIGIGLVPDLIIRYANIARPRIAVPRTAAMIPPVAPGGAFGRATPRGDPAPDASVGRAP
ncbi:MAG: NADH-quinone oxidoreductase subunit N [Gemmatimonadaceae bacterium]|nr:NADH-quinone oxidoreductase subunit N [Gemmatimonadaceae bacterium]